jgi:DNA-binding NtrC family response regulator
VPSQTPQRLYLVRMFRLLVIDDEEAVVVAVKRRLERLGYGVDTAGGAAEGMEKIADAPAPYDVIVTDMSMDDPDSGLKVLSAAFSRDLFAEVIVMTAYGNVTNAVECMRRGAFDYIEKNTPGVDVYEVLSIKIGQALDRRRRDVRTVELWERAAKSKERMPTGGPASVE